MQTVAEQTKKTTAT